MQHTNLRVKQTTIPYLRSFSLGTAWSNIQLLTLQNASTCIGR